MKKNLKKSTNIVSLEVKTPLENTKSHQYGERRYYLISVFGQEDFVLDLKKKTEIFESTKVY